MIISVSPAAPRRREPVPETGEGVFLNLRRPVPTDWREAAPGLLGLRDTCQNPTCVNREVDVNYTVKEILHNRVRDLLHLETGPGLGCTEPAAIGLGAAAAASLLHASELDTIEVTLRAFL